jgi:repressor LexA
MDAEIVKYAEDKILKFIKEYMNKNGWSPSVREICEGVGIPSTYNVHYYLKGLAERNKIVYAGVRKIRVI